MNWIFVVLFALMAVITGVLLSDRLKMRRAERKIRRKEIVRWALEKTLPSRLHAVVDDCQELLTVSPWSIFAGTRHGLVHKIVNGKASRESLTHKLSVAVSQLEKAYSAFLDEKIADSESLVAYANYCIDSAMKDAEALRFRTAATEAVSQMLLPTRKNMQDEN